MIRRPAPRWVRGVVLSAAVAPALLVAACSAGPVTIDVPEGSDADAQACAAFLADLPATLGGEDPRDVEPADAPGAAYGDPAYVVSCGVSVPAEYDDGFSSCEVVDKVGWYLPPEQLDDQASDATLFTVGYRPVVKLVVPHDYRPDGAAQALAELSGLVDEHLELVANCT
ncbi:hypothetical protein BH11ACT8_BH11ACT8_33090 [soil metagenome]